MPHATPLRYLTALAGVAVLAGCAAKGPGPLYMWESFPRQQYSTLLREGASPDEQIRTLEAHAEKARAANAALNGLRPENTPKFTASLFGEYRFGAVPGLAVSAGVFHTGNRMINQANTARVDGFTTVDVGVRYATEFLGNETTFRLNAENVTNEKYWAATASSLLNPNLPPAIKLSVTTRFGAGE